MTSQMQLIGKSPGQWAGLCLSTGTACDLHMRELNSPGGAAGPVRLPARRLLRVRPLALGGTDD